ncbi:MAG: hypothetical protein EOP56_07695 [Sphingobacteriales bacterium]|nr:MAG: hypothetical protein EOP56_07695 [Sphingobacteriales bacterium]
MAKHLIEGKEFPLFFYGQYYGFSLIEELFIIPFYWVMGITAHAVKLGMLALWTIGVLFFYKALVKISGNKWSAFLTTLIFVVTPAWALWSFKARGGYLTSHFLTSVILCLLFDEVKNKKNITYVLIGFLLLLIFQSQPFWLAGVIPLLVYKLLVHKSFAKAGFVLLPILILSYPLYIYKQGLHQFYNAPIQELTTDLLIDNINRFPAFLYTSLHGAYHFAWAANPDFFSAVFAYIFMGMILVAGLAGILHLFEKNNRHKWLLVSSTLFLPLVLGYSLFSQEPSYRYMLPVTVFTLFSLYLFLYYYNIDIRLRVQNYVLTAALIGAIGTATYYRSQLLRSHGKSMAEAISYLEKEQVSFVFVDDYTFQWDILFLTKEKIKTRFFFSPGRYPAYDSLVDRGLHEGKRVAVFGHAARIFGDSFGHFDFQNTDYYISLNPTKETLSRNKFQFHDWKFK